MSLSCLACSRAANIKSSSDQQTQPSLRRRDAKRLDMSGDMHVPEPLPCSQCKCQDEEADSEKTNAWIEGEINCSEVHHDLYMSNVHH